MCFPTHSVYNTGSVHYNIINNVIVSYLATYKESVFDRKIPVGIIKFSQKSQDLHIVGVISSSITIKVLHMALLTICSTL